MNRLLLFIGAAAIVALVIFGHLPGDTRFWHTLQDTAHAPAFFSLALIISFLTGRRRPLLTFVVCVLTGIAIEEIQGLIGGDVSLKDVITDTLGTLAGISFNTYLASRRLPSILVCFAALAVAAAPLMWSAAAYLGRDGRFPVLAEFHSPLDLYFVEAPDPAVEIRNRTLYVPLSAERWPGIAIDEPCPDWSAYRTLAVDLTNPTHAALSLRLRVHDRAHTQSYDDRFNGGIELAADSRTVVRIPLSQMRAAPATRHMDMTRIAGIMIFGRESLAGKAFYLNRIWLE